MDLAWLRVADPQRTCKPVPGRGAFVRYPASVHGWGNQVEFRHVWNDVANNELTAVIAGQGVGERDAREDRRGSAVSLR